MQRRNWKEYNEKLVKRGEVYISLDFLENWDEELEKMNKGKVGRPYIYPETFIYFLGFLHIVFLPFRQLEGFLRRLSEYIPRLKTLDYSTIYNEIEETKYPASQ